MTVLTASAQSAASAGLADPPAGSAATNHDVLPGASYALVGTVLAGNSLTVDGGTSASPIGGIVSVGVVVTNDGLIALLGGTDTAPGQTGPGGASLTISATGDLINAGTLALDASAPGTFADAAGPTLVDSGLLANAGTILLGGGFAGYGTGGQGGTLLITSGASLVSSGQITIAGGTGGGVYQFGTATGATLLDAGMLVSTGTVSIGAANTAGYRGQQATAGVLTVTGLFESYGLLTIAGSQGYYGAIPAVAPPATLQISGELVNTSTIEVGGGTQAAIYSGAGGVLDLDHGDLFNSGLISLAGGQGGQYGFTAGTGATLVADGVLTNSGTITLAAGSPWYPGAISGAAGPGAALIDSGLLGLYGGLLALQGGTTLGSLGATALFNGELNDAGRLVLYGGTQGGTGASLSVASLGDIRVVANGTVTIGAGVSAATLSDGGIIRNSGTVTVAGGITGTTAGSQGGLFAIDTAGSVANSGLITIQGGFGGGIYDFATGSGATLIDSGLLINYGSLVIGAATAAAYRASQATGGVLIDSGALINRTQITVGGSAGYYNGGNATPPGATLEVTGLLSNHGTVTIDGGTQYVISGGQGGLVADLGRIANAGLIRVGGGQGGQYSFFASTAATLQVAGLLANTGQIQAQGGTAWYPGATGGAGGPGGQISVSGVLASTGLIALYGGTGHGAYGATLTVAGTLLNAGTLAIGAGSAGGANALLQVSASGTLVDSGLISGAGTLDNAGTLTAGGRGASEGQISTASFLNDGLVRVNQNASLDVSSAVTGTGSFTLQSGSSLTLDSAAAQLVRFSGGGATLGFGDPFAFTGVLDGLQAGTTLDFLGQDLVSAEAVGASLDLGLAGGGALSLALGAPLGAGLSLGLASDGQGGTDVLVTQTG